MSEYILGLMEHCEIVRTLQGILWKPILLLRS